MKKSASNDGQVTFINLGIGWPQLTKVLPRWSGVESVKNAGGKLAKGAHDVET